MTANEQSSAPNAPKPKRGFRILLGVSLALNLLVIGAIVGVVSKGPSGRGGPPGMREVSAPYVAAFDRSDKREMRKQMRERLPGREAARARNNADYAAFLALVRAESFDAAQARSLLEQQLKRAGEMQQIGRELAIERIEAMSADERKAYADRVQDWLDHRSKFRRSKSAE